MSRKTNEGFTLIELLVVIAIIAMLSSIVMAGFSDTKQKGRDAGKIRALQELKSALQLYATDNGSFPNAIKRTGADTLSSLLGSYIKSIDPTISYISLNTDRSTCTVAGAICQNYWLGISLERTDAMVLKVDNDINVSSSGPSASYWKGTHNGCILSGAEPNPDLCYDIVAI
ncbi:MAG: type II secretion system protein [Candidatus Paceibacterota bacterium]|jgi:prepilin-type N-terminal cleavage/methylation domain-containing protein